MIKTVRILLVILLFLVFTPVFGQENEEDADNPISTNKELEYFTSFVGDTLLSNKKKLIEFYIKKYAEGYCCSDLVSIEDFEGVQPLGDLNNDGIKDTLFVLPVLSPFDVGDSYYFFDQTIPRLSVESYCCHPYNVFAVDDIDEDGIKEIVVYYSSCSSRYKSLKIFSLRNDKWVQIGISGFDVLTKDSEGVNYSTLVKKIKKNKFKMCNFDDGKTYWKTITIKMNAN